MCNSVELNARDREIQHLRARLKEWIDPDVNNVEEDEQWAEVVLQRLQRRGFVYIERRGDNDVLSCLGRHETVHIARGPSRALAVARAIRQFADNARECRLLMDQ